MMWSTGYKLLISLRSISLTDCGGDSSGNDETGIVDDSSNTGDSNNCFYSLHSDNGLLYDAKYDGTRNIYYYMRNTTTGLPQYLGGLLLESDHESLYYQTEYSMRMHNRIAYFARRRRSDDGIELWSSDFVNSPQLLLDIVPSVYVTTSNMDIDDDCIAIGSDRNILVLNLSTNTYEIHYLTGPGTLYAGA